MAKKVGMMQPYLFPYLGYFQLISAVDEFVLGDDLQYVKESWINRNRILMHGKERLISFPLRKSEIRTKINEKVFADGINGEIDRLVRVLYAAYAKAPCYKKVFPLLEEILRYPEMNLARYAENSIRKICAFLDISTPIHVASDLDIVDVADKQDRVIKTVKKLEGEIYINFIGGVELYDFARFAEHRVRLRFHKIDDIRYQQFGDEFIPLLSIIDVLMFNDVPEVKRLLSCYSLRDAGNLPLSVHAVAHPLCCAVSGVG